MNHWLEILLELVRRVFFLLRSIVLLLGVFDYGLSFILLLLELLL